MAGLFCANNLSIDDLDAWWSLRAWTWSPAAMWTFVYLLGKDLNLICRAVSSISITMWLRPGQLHDIPTAISTERGRIRHDPIRDEQRLHGDPVRASTPASGAWRTGSEAAVY